MGDTIKYDFVVRDDVTPDTLLGPNEKPEDGCHVYGMFIEGARWCDKTHLLADAEPKALYSEMPPFLFLPKQNRVQAEQGIYECLCTRCSREPERSRQPATRPTS